MSLKKVDQNLLLAGIGVTLGGVVIFALSTVAKESVQVLRDLGNVVREVPDAVIKVADTGEQILLDKTVGILARGTKLIASEVFGLAKAAAWGVADGTVGAGWRGAKWAVGTTGETVGAGFRGASEVIWGTEEDQRAIQDLQDEGIANPDSAAGVAIRLYQSTSDDEYFLIWSMYMRNIPFAQDVIKISRKLYGQPPGVPPSEIGWMQTVGRVFVGPKKVPIPIAGQTFDNDVLRIDST